MMKTKTSSNGQHHHHHHRSKLSQSNKPFKSRHASKRSIKGKLKTIQKSILLAKTQSMDLDTVVGSAKKKKSLLTKGQRKVRSRVVQALLKQQTALKSKQNLYTGATSLSKVVALIPLCPDIDVSKAVQHLSLAVLPNFQSLDGKWPYIIQTPWKNQRISLLLPSTTSLASKLEAAMVADYVMFLVSAQVEVDEEGEQVLSAFCAQGVPSVHCMVQHLEAERMKRQPEIRKALLSYMLDWFPSLKRIWSLHKPCECLQQLRSIAETCPDGLSWRDKYAYLLIEENQWEPDGDVEENKGTLSITGSIRGNALSPNRLIHLPGFGDYRISKITTVPKHDHTSMHYDVATYTPDSDADDLVSMNEEDTLFNEQTWPTEEELALADQNAKKRVLKVPKGTSLYQAAWMCTSEDEESEESHEDRELRLACGMMEGLELDYSCASDLSKHTMTGEAIEEGGEEVEEVLEDFDVQKDQADHAAYMEAKQQDEIACDSDEDTDEVDVPPDQHARVRFQRYRGMQSARQSSWDANEQLPVHYGRLFQLAKFRTTRRQLIAQQAEAPIPVGTRVCITLSQVPRSVVEVSPPWYAAALLPFEHQYAETHYLVTARQQLVSKRPLRMQVGFRTFLLEDPLFSEPDSHANKCARYLRRVSPKQTCAMTILAPMAFLGPVLLFDVATRALVATGTVSPQPRLVIKRILLTGKPYKLHKKVAVVRWMFFNAPDVHWFRPVQLQTRLGRLGHIRESIGTHGYMKCSFDHPLKQHDRVYMPLYKRVFPKTFAKLAPPLQSSHEKRSQEQGGMEVD